MYVKMKLWITVSKYNVEIPLVMNLIKKKKKNELFKKSFLNLLASSRTQYLNLKSK